MANSNTMEWSFYILAATRPSALTCNYMGYDLLSTSQGKTADVEAVHPNPWDTP